MVWRHGHVLRFHSIYFSINLSTSDYKSFCIFLCSVYVFAEYINIISINVYLMCAVLFQTLLVSKKQIRDQTYISPQLELAAGIDLVWKLGMTIP